MYDSIVRSLHVSIGQKGELNSVILANHLILSTHTFIINQIGFDLALEKMSLLVRPSSNAALKAFAEQLGPLPAARAFGHREVQKVFEAIKTCSDNIAYNRIRIMGGDEQKTSCWATLDFDCVAFVNGT